MVRFVKQNDYQTRSKTANSNVPQHSTPVKATEGLVDDVGAASVRTTPLKMMSLKRQLNNNNKKLIKVESQMGEEATESSITPRKKNSTGEKTISVTTEKAKIWLLLQFCSSLKKIVKEDDQMMKQKFIGRIPAPYSIDRIVEEFSQTINDDGEQKTSNILSLSRENLSSSNLMKTVDILVKLFNISLPKQLLYKLEEAQYQEVMQNKMNQITADDFPVSMKIDNKPSQFYGIIHFVRFLTILPSLLEKIEMSDGELEHFIHCTNAFIKFLSKNHERYWKPRVYTAFRKSIS